MKKRGFTLIELLAVIVVLAIIALIATPIVMNVIKNAQMGAAERSADNYVKAVETLIATNKLDGNKVEDGEYTIQADGNLTFGSVEVSGTKPNGGTIVVENGQVVKEESSIVVGDYTVTYKDGVAEAKENGNTLVLCTATSPSEQDLFDSNEWVMGTATVGVQATSEAPYAKGAVYSCDLGDGVRTFYVLKEESDKVKLIMNENIGSPIGWIDEGDFLTSGGNPNDWNACINVNVYGPITANEHLASKTTGWSKLEEVGGTVALPTYDEMISVKKETWMHVNLDGEGAEYACGYWTSTPDADGHNGAWGVYSDGNLGLGDACGSFDYDGVRPVITISKENMSL